MTEPELEETIQWEEDRLFGSEPVQSGITSCPTTPEGYEVLVIRHPEGNRRQAGRCVQKRPAGVIAWGISPPDLVSDTGGGQAMDPGARAVHPGVQGILLQVQENAWRSKQLRLQEDTAQVLAEFCGPL